MEGSSSSARPLLTAVPVAASGTVGPSAAILALYLAATAVPLAAGGVAGGRGFVILAHLATLALIVRAEVSRAHGTAGAWSVHFSNLQMLVLLPVLYAELPFLMEGLPGTVEYRDPLIQGLEGALFGFQPAWQLAGMLPFAWLSEVLHAAYLLYYPIIYVPPLLLYARLLGRRGDGGLGAGVPVGGTDADEVAFRDTVLAVSLSVLACFVVFVVFPVQGPRYIAPPTGVPDGPLRALALAVLEGGSSRGAAFPSSHVSVAVAQTLLALRFQRTLGIVLVPVTVLLALGAVYGGFHYAIDALVGAAVGGGAAWVARPLGRALGRAFSGFTPAPEEV